MKKSTHLMKLVHTFAILVAALSWQGGPSLAQNIWNQNGSAGNPNWSAPGNWGFFAIPGPTDNVLFDIYGFTNIQGAVNNVVDTSFTISTLGYSLVNTNGFHTTQINPGLTLSVVPQPGAPYAVAVGEWVPGGVPVAGAA